MSNRLREVARDERGFTLIELLNVLLIIGILTAIAGPSYLSFRDKAYQAAAGSNVKALVNAAQSYWQDNFPASPHDPDKTTSTTDTGYQSMTIAALKAYDPSLSSSGYVNNSGSEAPGVTTKAPLDATHYCVYAVVGRWYAYQLNPNGTIKTTTDWTKVCT